VVQTTAFARRKSNLPNYKSVYCRLIEPKSEQGKCDMFFEGINRYCARQSNFKKIPGSPIAYWVSKKIFESFDNQKISDYGSTNNGFTTGDNNLFLRMWYEVNHNRINYDAKVLEETDSYNYKWYPYNKGGAFRKWYGNNDFVINWEKNGKEIKEYGHLVPRSMKYQLKRSISWSKISSSVSSFKTKSDGTMFDVAGLSLFVNLNEDYNYLLALLNSIFTQRCLEFLSPTLNYETGHISSIPVKKSKENFEIINQLTQNNIGLSKTDWDSFETSWDFERHPLV